MRKRNEQIKVNIQVRYANLTKEWEHFMQTAINIEGRGCYQAENFSANQRLALRKAKILGGFGYCRAEKIGMPEACPEGEKFQRLRLPVDQKSAHQKMRPTNRISTKPISNENHRADSHEHFGNCERQTWWGVAPSKGKTFGCALTITMRKRN